MTNSINRFIKSRNRQNLGYRLKANHMADMTEEEIRQKKGLLTDKEPDVLNGGKRFEIPEGTNVKTLPDTVNWEKSGEREELL